MAISRIRTRAQIQTDYRQTKTKTDFLKNARGEGVERKIFGSDVWSGALPLHPGPKDTLPPGWNIWAGALRMSNEQKNTLRGWSTAISCVALRKILSGCRHSVPIGLVCLWVGAKVQLFPEPNKFYSKKFIFRPSERILGA